jgi:signal transduction histidine kinase
MKQLKKFRLDRPEPIVTAPTKVDEFQLLNNTIERLLKRNIDIYQSQKSFIENAAHELQTPLGIAINKLEAMADSNQLSESQLSLLGSAMDNLERLTRLNRSLLLLSKIENKQFAANKPVNINELVRKIVDDFSDQAIFSDVKIDITEVNTCIQNMNEDLALVLVGNLIKNAILHNRAGGYVRVVIDQNSLIMENSGAPPALDPGKIFDRFSSGRTSPTSTGLGLAIVKAITDLYNFRLTYGFEEKHTFLLQF